jgi:hypothetical protein
MVFGSFGDYKLETPLHLFLFMITAIMMPLLMMNLLIAILGQTYNDVKESWADNMYYDKVSIIYDLELLMVWNRKVRTSKSHLLYANIVKDDH